MLVMPSDHAIGDLAAFRQAIERAAAAARAGRLVTFGITPERAETGYGYIASGRPLERRATGVFAVTGFVEKPDPETAERYVASGEYFWNSGIFLFPARAVPRPSWSGCGPTCWRPARRRSPAAKTETDFVRLDKDRVRRLPERLDRLRGHGAHARAPRSCRSAWGGAISARGTRCGRWATRTSAATRSPAMSSPRRRATAICARRPGSSRRSGSRIIVVVATDDAVMVAPRNRTQEVKQLVGRLLAEKRDEADALPTVHRPWGSYRSLHNGHRVQVKHIMVRPGGKLSLQMHHHRAEHWVVVQGTAKIVRGNEEMILTEDQSTYIPLGTPHRLENPGKIPLHVIEVQIGQLSRRRRHRPLRGPLRAGVRQHRRTEP